MKRTPTTIAYVFFLLFSSSFYTQKESDVLIQELYGLWDDHYKTYSFDPISGDIKSAEQLILRKDSAMILTEGLDAAVKKAEAAVIKKDWGLVWNNSYVFNSAPGMEMADNIIYRSRLQSELSWSLLNDGFAENRTLSKIRYNESLLASFVTDEKTKKQELFTRWHGIIYTFNILKIEILKKRLDLSKSRVDVAYKLSAQGLLTQEELIKNLEGYAEVKSLLNIYADYNKQLSQDQNLPSNPELPLFDINYAYSLSLLEQNVSDSVKLLLLENLEYDSKSLNDFNLRLFSRYNYYDLVGASSSNRSFLSFGVSVGIPLTFDRKEEANLYDLQRQKIENDLPDENLQNQKDVLGYFYEFRYKLKQFNGFYYKRLMMQELLRKEQARHQIDPLAFNPVKALRLLDELMSIDIELIDLKQQMYLYLLRIYTGTPHADLSQMLQPMSLEMLEIKETLPQYPKEVYVWSKTLETYSNDFLINYLEMNGMSHIVLSIGGDQQKLVSFINAATSSGIVVDLMVGNNELINADASKIKAVLEALPITKVKGIHLDVEPHTFSDWKERKEEYLGKYMSLATAVKSFCETSKLEFKVSLPLHYPAEFVSKLSEQVDQIYFMCYENVKTEYIVSKLSPFDAKNIVIALRTEDFNSRLEIHQKFKELGDKLNVANFIIHDLGRLIQMEE